MCHHYESERLTEYELAYDAEDAETDDEAELEEADELEETDPAVPPADD
jgi:hypothetical protein